MSWLSGLYPQIFTRESRVGHSVHSMIIHLAREMAAFRVSTTVTLASVVSPH